ncbi:MAG: rod shape-determining protein RodA [Holosporaceae bacterium]|jgi:rod shape determining protein RodA|nr:rod shape-determining protein RodA [Holosporaceae bacterium]
MKKNEFKILFFLVFALFFIGFLAQYSTNGGFNCSVQKHLAHICMCIIAIYLTYIVDLKFWNNYAYLFYSVIFIFLLVVDILGVIRLGAQRWIDLYFFTFQPSELMKLAIVFSLARYYSMLSTIEIKNIRYHILPLILILLPVILILKQPDLGTAGLLLCVGLGMVFLSGFHLKIFGIIIGFGIALCPICWFFLHDYQKNRMLTFFDPSKDPLGIGYHILQSKIAIGSGRILGKGFMQGSQSKLNFLPEKNTDFIFTSIVEESGFLGAFLIISLFLYLTFYFFWAASEVRNRFACLMCQGLGITLFLQVFINTAMVIGIVPVVGIPLPFLSYGGTSMLTFAISSGLVMSAFVNRKLDGTKHSRSHF